MATSKFRPTEIPDQVSPAIREYLDRTLQEMSVLLDGAADFIDDATIAHTDDDETITGAWSFTGGFEVVESNATLVRTLFQNTDAGPAQTDLHIENQASDLYLGVNYGGVANAFIDNRTAGNLLIKEVGTDLVEIAAGSTYFYNNVYMQQTSAAARLTVGDGTEADGNVLINLSLDRAWQFRQAATGASTRLELFSTTNKIFDIGGDTLGSYVLRVNTAGNGMVNVIDALTVGGEATFSDAGYAVKLVSTAPKLYWEETDAATDEKIFDIVAVAGELRHRILKDDESASHTWMSIVRSGFSEACSLTPATLNLSPSGNCNVSPGGTFQMLSGNHIRYLDPGNTSYVDIGTDDETVSSNHSSSLDCSAGCKFRMQAASIADDGTATFNIGGSYAIVFILTTYNATTYAHLGFAGTNAPIDFGSGSNVSVGAANPNIDNDINIWPSASGTMSIKNRMGSTRSFYIFSMEP